MHNWHPHAHTYTPFLPAFNVDVYCIGGNTHLIQYIIEYINN